jgi:protocatechuate 3,4-dioxygenase beta subunit
MKSRITKLAAAAVIAVAAIIGLRGFDGTTAWAEVIRAINNADNIHIVSRVTRANGLVRESHAWLKNRTMIYDEDPNEITVDDGVNRLTLDTEKMTAQLSDSYSPFKDYMETGNFEIILLFRGEQTPFKATELPDEGTSTMRVYEVTYRDVWKGRAWVDSESNLPVRIAAEVTEKYRQHALSMEVIYEYQPIPVEKFSLVIPPGYTELPRVRPRLFSGKVVDEKGKPVAGAEICTSNGSLSARTDEKGEFAIKLHPGRLSIGRFPMVVRGFKGDDPNRLAWTLLRNPRHELRPLLRSDDGKAKLERGGGVDIHLVEEKGLLEFIPADPGRMIFKNEADRYPSEVRDMVLQMGPASVITGRVVDREGRPIANAVVWIEYMVIGVAENEIRIANLGNTAKEREIISSMDNEEYEEIEMRAFARTDNDGHYELGNLPDVWYRVRLEVKADGYVSEGRRISQEERCDFMLPRGDVMIRGTVIDDKGKPLVGRNVVVRVKRDLDGDGRWDEQSDFDIEDGIVDSRGRFELTGVPMVPGVMVEMRTDEKPRDWGRTELTLGREFTYYLMIEEPIEFEPGKTDYWVEIVPHRPDITLEIEVKDSAGNLLEGVPVGICSTGFSERIWFTSKLNGRTDNNGVCTIKEVPRIEPFRVWVYQPTPRQMHYWRDDRDVNMEVKDAMTEFSGKYHPSELTIELEEGKKKYRIPVVMKAIDE